MILRRALECFAAETRFVPGLRLHQGSFSVSVGIDNRGATVDIELNTDQEVGGMAFKVVAEGY